MKLGESVTRSPSEPTTLTQMPWLVQISQVMHSESRVDLQGLSLCRYHEQIGEANVQQSLGLRRCRARRFHPWFALSGRRYAGLGLHHDRFRGGAIVLFGMGGKPMIIGYARVSTDGQTLEVQQAALTAAGAEKVFAEKVSGAQTDRKALARAVAALAADDVLL